MFSGDYSVPCRTLLFSLPVPVPVPFRLPQSRGGACFLFVFFVCIIIFFVLLLGTTTTTKKYINIVLFFFFFILLIIFFYFFFLLSLFDQCSVPVVIEDGQGAQKNKKMEKKNK